MSESNLNDHKEYRVLQAMKITLTSVVKDTATPPDLKHPLTEDTVENIRQCLMLISAREQELMAEFGLESTLRPRFTDEPSKVTAISIDKIGGRKPKDK
ncbi:MAG: segregation and condensation protein A [Gammaproteobacteria bacterium]|nr:segregation and condensation protein A [Gammaproteobacteria bacterium]